MISKIKKYQQLSVEIEKLARQIFKYVYNNHQHLLKFDKYSSFADFEVYDDCLHIKYIDRGYDIYEYDFLRIPFDYLTDENWKLYIIELDDQIQQKKYEAAIKEQHRLKEERKKMYQTLKDEFENEAYN